MQRPPSRPSLPASTARREASIWLARLERGLRDDEGTGLRQWMQSHENREAILREWQKRYGSKDAPKS